MNFLLNGFLLFLLDIGGVFGVGFGVEVGSLVFLGGINVVDDCVFWLSIVVFFVYGINLVVE